MGKVILGVFLGICLLVSLGLLTTQRHTDGGLRQNQNGETDQTATLSGETAQISVSAAKLWFDYHANEVAADNSYKGRRLHLQGIIASINKDLFDHTYLALGSPNEFMPIHANLNPSFVSEAASLSRGQSISLECTGPGLIIGEPILNDCSIVEDQEVPSEGSVSVVPPALVSTEPKDTQEASIEKPSQEISELMDREEALNEKCRGGSGDDAATQNACAGRELILAEIKAKGWCWGHDGQFGAEKTWEHCSSDLR